MSGTPPAGWIEPAPTEYAGIMFRSRLEALWAACLDRHGIQWEYEPAGGDGSPAVFDLPSGTRYQPDFWLPEIDGFLEVKGGHFQRIGKAREFAREMAPEYIVVLGWAPERREGKARFEPVMRWSDAAGLDAQFGRCQCGAAQWYRLRHSLNCKRCGQRADATVRLEQGSGSVPFLATRDDVAHDWLFRRLSARMEAC